MKLYAEPVGPIFLLMNDNARPHTAVIVDDYLESEGIVRMSGSTSIPLKIFGMPSVMLRVILPIATITPELQIALQQKCRLLDSAVADPLIESIITRCKLYM